MTERERPLDALDRIFGEMDDLLSESQSSPGEWAETIRDPDEVLDPGEFPWTGVIVTEGLPTGDRRGTPYLDALRRLPPLRVRRGPVHYPVPPDLRVGTVHGGPTFRQWQTLHWRRVARNRIARDLEVPPELIGEGDPNHWSFWEPFQNVTGGRFTGYVALHTSVPEDPEVAGSEYARRPIESAVGEDGTITFGDLPPVESCDYHFQLPSERLQELRDRIDALTHDHLSEETP